MSIQLVEILSLLLSCLIKLSRPFSYMVPQDSCYNINPVHNYSSQELANSPFKIIVGNNFYQHDDEIKVTLTSDQLINFMGFVLQARLIRTNHIVGTWKYNPLIYPHVGILRCLIKNNTLVHAWPEFMSRSEKYFTNLSVIWVAPNINNWDIEFIATVVQNYSVYWRGIKSKPLKSIFHITKSTSSCIKKPNEFIFMYFILTILFNFLNQF